MMKPRVLTLWAMTALAACHGDSSQAPKPAVAPQARAPAAAAKAGPSLEEQTAGMVEAASQGKGQAAVALKFDLPQRPTLGQPVEIEIALLPHGAADSAAVVVAGSEGVQLAPDQASISFGPLEPSQAYKHSLKVTPTSEGVLFVSLTVTLKMDDVTESRVFSVPLIVGALPPAKTAAVAEPKHPVPAPK
jgi:hypothetical protein